MEDMQYAFDKLALLNNNNENDDSNVDDEEGGHTRETRGMQLPPEYVERAQAEARDRITRIQFCWYQFQEFPRLTNTYVNIQHVDIRQNGKSEEFVYLCMYIICWKYDKYILLEIVNI